MAEKCAMKWMQSGIFILYIFNYSWEFIVGRAILQIYIYYTYMKSLSFIGEITWAARHNEYIATCPENNTTKMIEKNYMPQSYAGAAWNEMAFGWSKKKKKWEEGENQKRDSFLVILVFLLLLHVVSSHVFFFGRCHLRSITLSAHARYFHFIQ